jgi:hypothetical protein
MFSFTSEIFPENQFINPAADRSPDSQSVYQNFPIEEPEAIFREPGGR